MDLQQVKAAIPNCIRNEDDDDDDNGSSNFFPYNSKVSITYQTKSQKT